MSAAPECDLPELRRPYDDALVGALDYLFQQFRPVAIVVGGSIVRGNPDPSSDLDIFIFHDEPWRQRVQLRFAGVPVELFVNHPGFMEGYFEEDRARGRPTTAHMLATGHLALDTADGLMAGWIDRSREMIDAGPEVSDSGLTFQRYSTAMLFEDAVDIVDRDPDTATHLLHDAVASALRFRFWAMGTWQPRNKEFLTALATLDPALAALARRYYQADDVGLRLELATEIILQTTGETGSFDWETPQDPLP